MRERSGVTLAEFDTQTGTWLGTHHFTWEDGDDDELAGGLVRHPH